MKKKIAKRPNLTNVKIENSENLKAKTKYGFEKRNKSKKKEQSEELIALTQTWGEDLCE
jgi:hypothetical protein